MDATLEWAQGTFFNFWHKINDHFVFINNDKELEHLQYVATAPYY